MNELIREYGLDKINSLTKYPSILTYHELGSKGGLKNELCEGKSFPEDEVVEITEKVDGSNSRIIILNSDFIIGERERLSYAKGDRIITAEIVPTVLDVANNLDFSQFDENELYVIYGETYGYKINGDKSYINGSRKRKYRVFDIWSMGLDSLDEVLSKDNSQIASWRDNIGQPYYYTDDLQGFCEILNLDRTPVLAKMNGKDIPKDAIETKKWMEQFRKSQSILDEETEDMNQRFGRAEGVVIRTRKRDLIRKLRFDDYQKGESKGWK